MDEDVKALVKVPVKKEQRTRPVRIHRMPNKRANKDLGTLSPYLHKHFEKKITVRCTICRQTETRYTIGFEYNTQQVTSMPLDQWNWQMEVEVPKWLSLWNLYFHLSLANVKRALPLPRDEIKLLPYCSHAHKRPPNSLYYTAREGSREMIWIPGGVL